MAGDKARPIPQISLKIVLMVPIWTLSNPLQCLTSTTKSGGGGGSGMGDGISWLISVDYLCQQWFRKLIVSYLHQYQTFLVKTARSEYTYCSIICHFCSRQPVYKRERNPKQGITSCFKWLSDIISRFTECSLSPNSVYGSRMKTIATEMFKCTKNINPTS